MLIFQWRQVFENRSMQQQFSWYILKNKPTKWYLFLYHWWLKVLLNIRIIEPEKYYQKYWRFLENVNVQPNDLAKFQQYYAPKNLQFLQMKQQSIVLAKVPIFLLTLFCPKETIIKGLDVTPTGVWNRRYESFTQQIQSLIIDQPQIELFGDFKFLKLVKKATENSNLKIKHTLMQQTYLFRNKMCYFLYLLWQPAVVAVLSLLLTVLSLFIAGYTYSSGMVFDVYSMPKVLLLNYLPVLLISLMLFFLLGRIWASVGLNTLIFIGLAIANHYKLLFRDDPVTFADITLISEATNMTKKYTITFGWKHLLLLIVILAGLIWLKKAFKPVENFKYQIFGFIIVILATMTYGKKMVFNDDLYRQVAPVQHGNIWKATSQYMSKGFPYAFSHSVADVGVQKPEGYSKEKAQKLLAKYPTKSIPDSKKVNVIMVMLEAYNDFSKFPQLKLDPSVYSSFKKLQNESISGHLVTNIFAGGTIDTERKTVSGYSKLQNFSRDTDSFAWYFKNQGYETQALHPKYGWFYNRKNVDPVLGFDDFKYMENYYQKYNEPIVPDTTFFKSIHDFSKASKKPYFNLSVTYQNHGPYSTSYEGPSLLNWQTGYNKSDWAIVNNYLSGIKKTSDAMLEMTEMFEDDKPTVIMFYGDHNPWLGEGNSAYNMMNINLDMHSTQGYKNYYETPYIIWANQKAKKALNNKFVGEGPDFSPMYLLPEFFKQASIKGDSYMQYIQDLQDNISVFGNDKFCVDNRYVDTLNKNQKKVYNNYKIVEYYRMHKKIN